jgi:hypothetical protein
MYGLAGGVTSVGRGVSAACGPDAIAAASPARDGIHALQFEEATDDTPQEATLTRKRAVFSEVFETGGEVAQLSTKASIKATTSSAPAHSTFAEPQTIGSFGESTGRHKANIPVAENPTPVGTNEEAEAKRLFERDLAARPIPMEAFDHQTQPYGIETSCKAVTRDPATALNLPDDEVGV